MFFSKLFSHTTKEIPKEATIPSHTLLIRAGFIHQVSAGVYNLSPIAIRVLNKIENIIKKHLNKAGAQELKLGFVTPIELWSESQRADKYGKELLRFKDRKENEFVLGPTHEEMMVNFIRHQIKSYKQLPVNLYQINTKFRDESRPRFGILRAREFVMKDGYSFHCSQEDMAREFDLIQKVYTDIFEEIGLDFRAVDADSGAIGGSGSKEFMALANTGEDDIVVCTNCDYASNIETAQRAKHIYSSQIDGPFAYFLTPNKKTVKEVSEYLKVEQSVLIKAVVKKALFDKSSSVVIFFIRGNDELQETKALSACGANELEDVNEQEMQELGIVSGFIGPIELKEKSFFNENDFQNKTTNTLHKQISLIEHNFYMDKELQDSGSGFICGANKKDYHFVGLKLDELKDIKYKDLITVNKNDKCIKCKNDLDIKKGIEVGHIFQLGTKYSSLMNANFLDENGKSKNLLMGTYGIGVSRILSTCIEQSHDENGCIWQKSVAPFDIVIIISNAKDEELTKVAKHIYEELQHKDLEVLLDDRKDRFGAKMKDFELIGIPFAIIVGKGLEEQKVQLIDRKTLDKQDISIDTNVISQTINQIMQKIQ